MGKKWGIQITQVLTLALILSLQVTNSIKFVESQTDKSGEEEQVLVISTFANLSRDISPFLSSFFDYNLLVLNPIGASLFQKYAPLSNGEHDYIPQLAESDPIRSPDGLSFTVKLKPDLKFSNGNPLTADDVVFSYNLYLTPAINKGDYNWISNFFATNSSITKLDDLTILFEFNQSSAFNFDMLTQKPIIEISDDSLTKFNSCITGNQDNCDWSYSNGQLMIGAGPYVVESHDRENQEIQLVKNKFYHSDEVWPDRIIITGGFENNASTEVLSGKSDIIMIGTNSIIFSGLGNTDYELFSFPHARVVTLDLNMQHPVYGTGENVPNGNNAISTNNLIQAQLVRTALSYAMDRDYLGLEIWGGSGNPASAPISPIGLGFNSSIVPHEFSLEIAKGYLEQAGFDFNDIVDANGDGDYADENDTRFFDFTTLTRKDPNSREPFLNRTGEELSKIGIGMDIDIDAGWDNIIPRTFGWTNNTKVPVYNEGGFDAAIWFYSYSQPFSTDYLFSSSGLCNSQNSDLRCNNYKNYVNAELDTIIDEFETEGSDWVRRQELMSQIHQILSEDLPSIPISYPNSPVPIKSNVNMPNPKYIDSRIMLWEYTTKDGWRDPTVVDDIKDELDLSGLNVTIIIAVVAATAIGGLYLKRKS